MSVELSDYARKQIHWREPVRGAGRILAAPAGTIAFSVDEVVNLTPGDELYFDISPWRTIGATKTGYMVSSNNMYIGCQMPADGMDWNLNLEAMALIMLFKNNHDFIIGFCLSLTTLVQNMTMEKLRKLREQGTFMKYGEGQAYPFVWMIRSDPVALSAYVGES